jgi:DNA invertase Pin-like site-specific DNA recombinase
MEIDNQNNILDVESRDPFAQAYEHTKLEEKEVEKNEIVIEENDEVDEIENIIESKKENGVTKYHIKWVGKKITTWINKEDFIQLDLLTEFESYDKNRNDSTLPKRAYIYCRTSKRNADREVSLFDQEKYCLAFAKKNNINIIGVYRDNGISAKNMENQRALNYICKIIKKGECVMFYDVTRFSRDIVKAINCLEKLRLTIGALAHSCHDGVTWNNIATSRNTFRLHLSNSQMHSEVVSEKVKSAIAFRRERGDHIGSAPYGYKTEIINQSRKLVVNKEEQKVIDFISKQGVNTVSGKMSNLNIRKKSNVTPKGSKIGKKATKKHTLTPTEYRNIASIVNQKYKNRRNKPFTWQSIRKIHG